MSPRALTVAALLKQGMTVGQVAQAMGITSSAVSQHIARWPELRALRRHQVGSGERRLHNLRQELVDIYKETKSVQRYTKRLLEELDQELEAIQIDELLGLRPKSA